MSKYIIIYIVFFSSIGLFSQQKWTNTYLEGENPFGEDIVNYYDNGYLILGRYGPNFPTYSWLIKTDINGEVLWRKDIGEGNSFIVNIECATGLNGSIYLVGSTTLFTDDDPMIIKINSCGEKEWCRIITEDGNNYCRSAVLLPNGEIVVLLSYMNSDIKLDRVGLASFTGDGDLNWLKTYNTTDTLIHNATGYSLLQSPDGGFLITGYCSYEDTEPPYMWRDNAYFVKTDSSGNFEWEKVVHSDFTDKGGVAWQTVKGPNQKYYYSAMSHYYYNPFGASPALLKMDLEGNLVDVHDLYSPAYYGKMIEPKFISDSTLMASAAWGSQGGPKAVIIDTMGNILYQTNLLDNEWMAHTEVTQDNKLLFLTNIHDDEDNFSTYLFKFNNQLQSDTIYSQIFNYDSLCPYPIVNDTIVQDNCGIIVGNGEIILEKEEQIRVFPNPASKSFVVKSVHLESGGMLQLINIHGEIVKQETVPQWSTKVDIDVSNMPKGIYLLNFKSDKGKEVSAKVVVE